MRFLDRWLPKARFLTMILAAGVVGGLLAPLPSEAATPTSKPKLLINGVDVPLTWQGNNCIANGDLGAANDNYFLGAAVRGCWTVDNTTWNTGTSSSNTVTINGFILGSVSATNRARVIINDYSNTGEDMLKLTGITLKSALNGTTNLTQTVASTATNASDDGTRCRGSDGNTETDDCAVAIFTLINTFDNPGGQNAGDPDLNAGELYPYRFSPTIGASFHASGSQTNIGSRIRLITTMCFTWAAHGDNDFGCDVSNASNTYTRAGQSGKDGIGNNRVGVGVNGVASAHLHSGVITSGTLSYKTVPATAPNPSPAFIASCRTNGSGNSSQCLPTVRLDYVIWVQGTDTVKEHASPGGCGGSCNTVRAITTPKKAAVLYCGDDPQNEFYPESLEKRCQGRINGSIGVAEGVYVDIGATEAQTCEGTWCVIIQVDGTPPAVAEDKTIKFTASGLDGLPSACLPPDPAVPGSGCPIKLDSFISGVTGRGLYTLSKLGPAPPQVLTILISDFGPFQLDNVVCSGGAICQTLYDGPNSSTKIGFTVTGWAVTGRLLADLHMH